MNDLTAQGRSHPDTDPVITMSSRELADFTGKDISHIHRDIREMMAALIKDDPDTDHLPEDKDVRGYTLCFHLNRELTDTLLTGYSVVLRRRVIRRWQELEALRAESLQPAQPVHRLPQNYHEALVELTHEVGLRIELQTQVAADAPKVEFAMAVRNLDGACKIGDYGKTIGIGRNTLFEKLRRDGILMTGNLPYQRYLESGWFTVIEQNPYMDNKGKTHPRFCALLTGKGQVALQRKYAARIAAAPGL